jgi:hypothetical protein
MMLRVRANAVSRPTRSGIRGANTSANKTVRKPPNWLVTGLLERRAVTSNHD